MSNSSGHSVLIVGAGPTGMTAAIEAQRHGFRTRLIDKAEGMARWSQALVVQARTLEQFQRYGLAEEAIRRGRKLFGGSLWSDGKRIAHLHFENIPSRYPFVLFIPQRQTEEVLAAHLQSLGVAIERRTELLHFEQASEKVRTVLKLPDGRQEEVESDWLIGCDGAHSTVRHQLGIEFEGKALRLRFILGDLVLQGPDAPQDEVAIHFHQGNLVFMARLDDRLTRVFVGTHLGPGEDVQAEDKQELQLLNFQQALDRNGIRAQVEGADWMTPFSVSDRQAVRYREGRVFLAGDASHIHSPVGGQGMNTGIQDTANLLWKVAATDRGAAPVVLDSYGQERGEVGRHLLAFTERILDVGTSTHRWVEAVRDSLLPLVTSLTPVQKKAAAFLSETGIHYRDSAAVSDHHDGGGSLCAGDRMPDLSVAGEGLLQSWTTAAHLAICVSLPAEQVEALRAVLQRDTVVAIDSASLGEEDHKQLGSDPTLFLVRPDGYVGYRGPAEIAEASAPLAVYLRQNALLV